MDSTGSSSSGLSPDPAAPADVVVAVPAYNDAGTIRATVTAAREALKEFAPLAGRILVADGGSTDGTTAEASAGADGCACVEILSYTVSSDDLLEQPYHGLPGRARALRALFEAARDRNARAVAVVNAAGSDRESIARLLRPVLAEEAFDFVAPRYHRHPFDGALIKSTVQPVFRACYGVRLRQPMPADFGVSRKLLEHVLAPDVWLGDTLHTEVDLWLSAVAAARGFQICETPVGPMARGAREEGLDLGTAVAQVVGALFRELERGVSVWHRVRGARAVPLVGAPLDAPVEPPVVHVPHLVESYRLGFRELAEVWAEVLPPAIILELKRLANGTDEAFRIEDRTWARTVYDFAMGYRLRVIARDHLLRAMTPLYLGWLGSFVQAAAGETVAQIDARLERFCAAFEAEKPYLISRWRWPERFRPLKSAVT